MLQATFWLFFCWDILVSARYEIEEKKLGQKVPKTPAPDRVKPTTVCTAMAPT